MRNMTSLSIWTIALSFFIIIGAGHGIACVGLLEIAGPFKGFTIGGEDFSVSPTASYEKSLGAVALFSLAGQLLLLLSIILRKKGVFFWTKIMGLLFLWISFYYLVHNLFSDSLSQIGFFSGIPFLICSILLAYKTTNRQFQIPSADKR